jgi:hypothetical protein
MLVAMVTAPGSTGLGDDLRLALVLLGVQHLVRDLALRKRFSRLSSEVSMEAVPTSAGWPRFTQSLMSSMMASNFSSLGQVDQVTAVVADHRLVGRNDHDLETVDLLELEGLGIGRAGHAGELVVEAEHSSGR